MPSIAVIQNTVKKTEDWLDEIMDLMDWSDRKMAYKALRVVLQTLRDRLTVEEATDLGAQLPLLIRGTFYECWNPTGKPTSLRRIEEFTEIVNRDFKDEAYLNPEDITRAVLDVLSNHVSSGEIDDVIASMPKPLRSLWI